MCSFCESHNIELIPLNYAVFFHMTFENLDKKAVIGRCAHCQLLSHLMTKVLEKKVEGIYQSEAYANAPISVQTYLTSSGKRVSRFWLQSEILKKYLPAASQPNVLDIGCFKGGFLLEFKKHFPHARLHGFDVNPNLQIHFSVQKEITFWHGNLASINERFDVISLSFSLMYIKDIKGLLVNLHRLLKPTGYLYIQLVDITQNPYSLLLADQYYHFTPRILKNVLNQAGFTVEIVRNEHFARDIVVMCRLDEAAKKEKIEEDVTVHQALEQLASTKERLLKIEKTKTVCVLGTTTIAAFVDSILANRVDSFIDENVEHNKTDQFRGKKVYSPKAIDPKTVVIVPYGAANTKIVQRFSKQYQLKHFECV